MRPICNSSFSCHARQQGLVAHSQKAKTTPFSPPLSDFTLRETEPDPSISKNYWSNADATTFFNRQRKKAMSDYMPTEVVVDMLSRLPVKTLIKFSCVSKTWFSLISTHDFITMHLNRTLSNTKDPPYLLFRHFNEETEKENFTFLSYEDPFPNDHFSKHLNFVNPKPYWQHYEFFNYPSDYIELHCPYKSSNEFWFIVGISNGLVCMVDDTPSNTPYDIVQFLWNPSIHKSVFLSSPSVRLPSSYEPMEYLGFGYDPISDNYKVVRLVYLHGWDE